jgi:hypothetical protein
LLQRHPGGIPVGTDLGAADFLVLAADREETLVDFLFLSPASPVRLSAFPSALVPFRL